MRHACLALALTLTMGAPAGAAADDHSGKYIAGFLAAYEHVHSFIGRIAVMTDVKGKVANTKYLLALEKPNRTMMTLVSNPNLRAAEGTKIVWFGGPTVDVSTHFFGFPLKLSPAYNDKRLLGPRGDSMRDLSVVTAVAMTQAYGAKYRFVRDDHCLGRLMHVVEIRTPKHLPGIDYEQLWLDDQLHLPFKRDMFTGDKLVYHVALETFEFDKPLPRNTFVAD